MNSLQFFPVTLDVSGVEDLFVPNNSWRNCNKRSRFTSPRKDGGIGGDLESFNRPPKMIPHKDHRCLIVVLRNFNGTELDKEYSGKTPIQLNGTLNVSSIQSAKECATSLQQFYCLNASNHDLLCSTYKGGLLLKDGYNSS